MGKTRPRQREEEDSDNDDWKRGKKVRRVLAMRVGDNNVVRSAQRVWSNKVATPLLVLHREGTDSNGRRGRHDWVGWGNSVGSDWNSKMAEASTATIKEWSMAT
ncbi:hypothetical protein BHM03_00011842 [Ensete ventricosum]|nr:hypothetical protein BHM03_00011842 [Ensete ventricosum]